MKIFALFLTMVFIHLSAKAQEIVLSDVSSPVYTNGAVSFALDASGYPEGTLYNAYLINETDSVEILSQAPEAAYSRILPEGISQGTYELFAYGVTETGDMILPLNYTPPTVQIVFRRITLTGTSVGNEIVCLADNPEFDILFETEGDFPADVVFTAYADYIGPVAIGSVTGNDATSITVTDFAHPYSTTYRIYISTDDGYTSDNFLDIDVVHEIDPSLDYLMAPSSDPVVIPEGQPLEVYAYNSDGIGLSYKLVHLESNTSATDWFVVPDDPGSATVEDPQEGTYQLVARGVGPGSGIVCQDSVPLNMGMNSFTLEYETVTGTSKEALQAFSLFPNPASGTIHVKPANSSSENVLIQVTDMSGAVVISRPAENIAGGVSLVVESLTPGMYLVKLVTSDGVGVKTFLKN